MGVGLIVTLTLPLLRSLFVGTIVPRFFMLIVSSTTGPLVSEILKWLGTVTSAFFCLLFLSRSTDK